MQQLFDLIAKAKKEQSGPPFIGEGRHKLLLETYELVDKPDKITGQSKYALRATFMVQESAVHPVGSLVRASWRLDKSDWQLERELSRSQSFLMALLGTVNPDDVAANGAQLLVDTQPGRGIPILAYGTKVLPKNPPPVEKRPFVVVSWEHIPYTGELVAANRKTVETKGVASAPVVAPIVQPVPTVQNTLLSLIGKR